MRLFLEILEDRRVILLSDLFKIKFGASVTTIAY